ncbi:MAG: hypothetical protein JEZ12_28595 [Desulfobacterium sp.]|nr:hypothetical protein [Desulfobacterium sp.]
MRKNTDNLLITEFSTPKELVRRRKVTRFIDPENLHGNQSSLMAIMENFDIQQINDIVENLTMEKKIKAI